MILETATLLHVSLGGDEELLILTSGSSLFSSEEVVTMVRGISLVSNGRDDNMYIGSSIGESLWILSLDFGSGSNTGGYMSLIGGKERPGIQGGVSISLDNSSSIVSGSVAISSVDAGISGVVGTLRLNSRDQEDGDSGNLLTRTCMWSSCTGRYVMVEVDSENSP